MSFSYNWARFKGFLFLFRSSLQGATVYDNTNLVILGPREFRQRIVEAMDALKKHAPDALALLLEYVSPITLGRNSEVFVSQRKPGAILWGYRSANDPIIEIASGLAHEAFHCKLYWEYRDSHKGQEPPGDVF